MRDCGTRIESRAQLKNIGVVLKRAEPFLKIEGWSQKTLWNFN
jgi:predicted DNA-binding helix-hairpin-helix protein